MNHNINHNQNFFNSRSPLILQESSKKSKYTLTTPNTNPHSIKSKMIFKREKQKVKESIFSHLRSSKKIQIKRENKMMNKNKDTINDYIDVLNDANIDEGIVLNKYFAYLKKYRFEYAKSQESKFRQLIIPIKNQEKEIKNLKRNIKFFKSISNHMIMKYMIENKDKFNQYMNEINPYKTRNSLSLNYYKKGYATERSFLFNKNKIQKLNTYTNFDDNIRYIDSINNRSKNTISNLKLKIRNASSINKRDSLSSFTGKDIKNRNRRGSAFTIDYNRGSIDVKPKYFTPFINKENMKNSGKNSKSKNNEKLSSRSDYKTQKYLFSND